MSKKKNGGKTAPIPAAPAVENKENKEENVKKAQEQVSAKENPVSVLNPGGPLAEAVKVQANGMDPNHRVDLLNLTSKYFHDSPDLMKKFGIPDSTVEAMEHITMIGIAATWADEMTFSTTEFACKLRAVALPEIKTACEDLGIKAEKILALPVAEDGTVTVTSKEVKVSAETKKILKEENTIQNDIPELDPTKIENKTGVYKAIKYFLTAKTGIYENIQKAVNFYRSWLVIQAGEDQKAIDEINSRSVKNILTEISHFNGMQCPFIVNGIGNYLLRLTLANKSVVPAFCILRNAAKSRLTKAPLSEAREIADVCAVLIAWSAGSKIEMKLKNIKVLEADKKANAKAIELNKKEIETLKGIDEYIDNPTTEFADELLKNLTSEDKDVVKSTTEAYRIIAKAFYPDIDFRKKYENLDHNVQQYAGLVTDLFRDVTNPVRGYSKASITPLVISEAKPSSEEKPEEKQEKAEEKPAEEKPVETHKKEEKPAEPAKTDDKKSDKKSNKTLKDKKSSKK